MADAIRCVCCGRWTVEQVVVDRLDGYGPRTVLRVRHLGQIALESGDPARVAGLLARELDTLPREQ